MAKDTRSTHAEVVWSGGSLGIQMPHWHKVFVLVFIFIILWGCGPLWLKVVVMAFFLIIVGIVPGEMVMVLSFIRHSVARGSWMSSSSFPPSSTAL